MQRRNKRPAVILLVEDDPGDQELTRRALTEGVFRAQLQIVSDGEAALDYLQARNGYRRDVNAPFPDLMLLDLNMPRMSGQTVLKHLKQDDKLRSLPVVVMTTSDQEADIVRSYDLGCNSFITKPVMAEGFAKVIENLGNYWFELVTLPPREYAHGRC